MEKSTTNLDFLKRKNINISKANTENPSMPTSSVDIPNFWKSSNKISKNPNRWNVNQIFGIVLILNRC